MATRIVALHGTTLDAMAHEAHNDELGATLKDLAAEKANYAIYETGWDLPDTGLKFLPSPSVKPQGATLICTGKLTVGGGAAIDVDAYRLP